MSISKVEHVAYDNLSYSQKSYPVCISAPAPMEDGGLATGEGRLRIDRRRPSTRQEQPARKLQAMTGGRRWPAALPSPLVPREWTSGAKAFCGIDCRNNAAFCFRNRAICCSIGCSAIRLHRVAISVDHFE